MLKNFTVNQFDEKNCMALNFSLFHTVIKALVSQQFVSKTVGVKFRDFNYVNELLIKLLSRKMFQSEMLFFKEFTVPLYNWVPCLLNFQICPTIAGFFFLWLLRLTFVRKCKWNIPILWLLWIQLWTKMVWQVESNAFVHNSFWLKVGWNSVLWHVFWWCSE